MVEREYICNFCHFGHLPSFMHKYGNFENGACISETTARRANIRSISTLWGSKRVHVQLLELLPGAKFYAEIRQF